MPAGNRLLLLNLIHVVIIAILLFVIIWRQLICSWQQVKERVFIIFICLTLCHSCLYCNQFSISEYIRCQLVVTRQLWFFVMVHCLTVFVFLIGCIQQYHRLIKHFILFRVDFFWLKNRKNSCIRKRSYYDFSSCACAKLNISSPLKNFWSELRSLDTIR